MLTRVQRGRIIRPRKTLMYGTAGIGKTLWASQSVRPLFLACEAGTGDLDVDRTPLITEFAALQGWISDLITQPHDYVNIVIDSIDWAEKLLWKWTAQRNGKESIEDFKYGKGFFLAMDDWEYVLKGLDILMSKCNVGVILLAHAEVTKFQDPTSESYNRYEPALHNLAKARLQEWCDEVFFATTRIATTKSDEGFNRTRTRAIDLGERVFHTRESATHLAKRRIQMPDTCPLHYSHYAAAIAHAYSQAVPAGNIAGIVVDGSSKKKQSTAE